MSQRSALLVATALTVFVMILMVGVVWQVYQKSNVDALSMQAAAPTPTAETTGQTQAVSGPTQAQLAEREAALQQLIQQANQRLAQAYQKQQDLSKQLQAEQQKLATPTVPASQPVKYNVSPDQAASIALTTEKGAKLVKPAELVSFQGTAAYEVTLDRGSVFVDANSGKVLYDSAVVIVVHDAKSNNSGGGSPAPSSSGGGGSKDDSEHSGGGDD